MIRAATGFAWMTAANLFAGKRAWAAFLLALLPPTVALLVVIGAGERINGTELYQSIAFLFSLRIMMFLLALIFGIAFSSGEIEEGTVGYLYLGALPKWAITLIQIGVASVALTGLMGGSFFLTGLAATAAPLAPLENLWGNVGACTLLASIGMLTSLSFYVACGLTFRRPLIVSLIATFLWEIALTPIPVPIAAYTVTNNIRALMLPLVFDGDPGRWYRRVRNYELPTYGEAAMYLSILAGLFLVAAMVASMNRSVEGKEAR